LAVPNAIIRIYTEYIQYKNNEMQTTKLILDDEANGIVRRRSSLIPRKNLKFKKKFWFLFTTS
ncbi:MAG: hypothetical protein ACI90V_003730, partial [Bacillariaceae sp.]